MKPRIFIGSSREGHDTAKYVQDKLGSTTDSQIWDEGFFENNTSSFEALAEGAVLFDFAILVATMDDVQLKRDKLESIARDNVLFEFGLYVGRIGKNRSFFIKEKGLDLPSDLLGITLLEYKTDANVKGRTLDEVCDMIRKRVEELWSTYELSFVPSATLAVGYFENFVSNVCRELMQSAKREVNGHNYNDFRMHIVIPDELPNNFQDQVIAYLSEKNLKEMKVETVTRKYNFYLDYAEGKYSVLELYDLPTTLSALKRAIEMAIPRSYVGEGSRERALKKKEMNNFYRTLQYLINENSITKNKVVIQFIDVK